MPNFYEITAQNGKKSYLFGTIHLSHKEVTILPMAVKEALQKASSFVCESNQDDAAAAYRRVKSQWDKQFLMTHNFWRSKKHYHEVIKNVSNHLPLYITADYIRKLVAHTPPMELIRKVSDLLDNDVAGDILDRQLERFAKKNNKEIHCLESAQSAIELRMSSDFSYEEQREFFDHQMKNFSKYKKEADDSQQKQDYLDDIIDENYMSNLKTAAAKHELDMRFFQKLIPERDKKMLNNMDQYLQNGNAFFAVGCFHLNGITKGLTQKGYTVEAIVTGKRIYPILDFYERNDKSLINTGMGFIIGGVLLAAGSAISMELVKRGFMLLGTAVLAAKVYKAMGLIYEYINEPVLPNSLDIEDTAQNTMGDNELRETQAMELCDSLVSNFCQKR